MTTNYERIKSMSIEEMARRFIQWDGYKNYLGLNSLFMSSFAGDVYKDNVKWLQTESKE